MDNSTEMGVELLFPRQLEICVGGGRENGTKLISSVSQADSGLKGLWGLNGLPLGVLPVAGLALHPKPALGVSDCSNQCTPDQRRPSLC